MSDQDSDKQLDKIRKLLAKAEDPACSPAEAEALNEKVAELIAKYGIERALLENDSKARVEVGDRIIVCHAPYMLDKAILLHNVALPLQVTTVRRAATQTRTHVEVHLFGFEADLDRVELLFTSLLVQASYGMTVASPSYLGGKTLAAWRRSWLAGFTVSVTNRLELADARARAEADVEREGKPSTELVLASRSDAVARRVKEVYPNMEESKARRLSGAGYQKGKEAGERADLGGTRVGSRGRREVNA